MKTITFVGQDTETHRYLTRRLKSLTVNNVSRPQDFSISAQAPALAILALDSDFPDPFVELTGELIAAKVPFVVLSSVETNGKHLAPLQASIEVLEPLGAEIILELSARGYTFTARMEPQLRAQMHDEIQIYFDMDRAHLFDRQTEQAIV